MARCASFQTAAPKRITTRSIAQPRVERPGLRPVRLNANVNAGPSDTSPFLSPDGNALLFYSERSGGFGQADLYVSTKRDGDWQAAVNLGATVNTRGYEYNPAISRDGATLYFGRDRRIWSMPLSE